MLKHTKRIRPSWLGYTQNSCIIGALKTNSSASGAPTMPNSQKSVSSLRRFPHSSIFAFRQVLLAATS